MLTDLLHLLRPYWLLAIIPVFIVWLLAHYRQRATDPWQAVCDPTLLAALYAQQTDTISSRSHRWLSWCILLSLITTVIALAGPSWQYDTVPVYQRDQAQVIVLDLSNAMYATDLKPKRLARARYKVLDLLQHLTEGETGMVVFAQEAYVVSPLTQDTHTIAAMATDLTPEIMPAPGHNIAAGLTQAEKLLTASSQTQHAHIILLTADNPTSTDIALAKQLQQRGITVSVMGIGTTEGAPMRTDTNKLIKDKQGHITISRLNQQMLTQLAKAGGGIYTPFSGDDHDTQRIIQSLSSTTATKKQASQSTQHWHDQGRWLLIPVLLILLCGFRRGWLIEAIR